MNIAYTHIIQSYLQHIQAEVSMSGYEEFKAGWSDEKVPDGYLFSLLLSGQARIEWEGETYEANAGDLALIPAGKYVRFSHQSGDIRVAWCQFGGSPVETKLFELIPLPLIVSLEAPSETEKLFQRIMAAEYEDSLTSPLKLKAAFLELLSCYLDHCELDAAALSELEPFAKLAPVLEYIDANLDKPVAVEDLANLTYMHPNYFMEFFKSLVGMSPIHYVNRRKLEYAKKQLELTEDHVAQIASQIGMQNHYLSRMFKQYCGLSPSQYRKKYWASCSMLEKYKPEKAGYRT